MFNPADTSQDFPSSQNPLPIIAAKEPSVFDDLDFDDRIVYIHGSGTFAPQNYPRHSVAESIDTSIQQSSLFQSYGILFQKEEYSG